VTFVYFDASALVKLVVDEQGSELAAALWDGCDAALTSRLAYPEVCAALAAACRNHQLSTTQHELARTNWERFWNATRPIELTVDVAHLAGELARDHALRGSDAVHLASALALEVDDLVIAVWDRRLHDGAMAVGMGVAPSMLEGSG